MNALKKRRFEARRKVPAHSFDESPLSEEYYQHSFDFFLNFSYAFNSNIIQRLENIASEHLDESTFRVKIQKEISDLRRGVDFDLNVDLFIKHLFKLTTQKIPKTLPDGMLQDICLKMLKNYKPIRPLIMRASSYLIGIADPNIRLAIVGKVSSCLELVRFSFPLLKTLNGKKALEQIFIESAFNNDTLKSYIKYTFLLYQVEKFLNGSDLGNDFITSIQKSQLRLCHSIGFNTDVVMDKREWEDLEEFRDQINSSFLSKREKYFLTNLFIWIAAMIFTHQVICESMQSILFFLIIIVFLKFSHKNVLGQDKELKKQYLKALNYFDIEDKNQSLQHIYMKQCKINDHVIELPLIKCQTNSDNLFQLLEAIQIKALPQKKTEAKPKTVFEEATLKNFVIPKVAQPVVEVSWFNQQVTPQHPLVRPVEGSYSYAYFSPTLFTENDFFRIQRVHLIKDGVTGIKYLQGKSPRGFLTIANYGTLETELSYEYKPKSSESRRFLGASYSENGHTLFLFVRETKHLDSSNTLKKHDQFSISVNFSHLG